MKKIISTFLLTIFIICLLFNSTLTLAADDNDDGIGKEIIIESGGTGFSTEGTWANNSSLLNPSGASSWFTTSSGASARYTPKIEAGTYEVYFWRLSHTERNDKAMPVTISCNGDSQETTVNFEGNGIDWQLIGKYYFSGEDEEYVEFKRGDDAGDTVSRTGAVRFVKVGGEQTNQSNSQEKVSKTILDLTGVTDGVSLEKGITPTRADFVKMALAVVNMDYSTYNGIQKFLDIDRGNSQYGNVSFATDLGVILGTGDGFFHPDEKISYAEATKIIISILGYDYMVKENNGYPLDYISVAMKLDLLDNVNIKDFDGESVAELLYNALNTKVGGIYSDKNSIEPSELTALEMYHNIFLGKGTVNSIDGLSITNDEPVKGEMVRIGDQLLVDSEGIAVNYIGQSVEYYYKKDGENKLIYIDNKKYNDIAEILDDEIIEVDIKNNQVLVKYEKDSSVRTLSTSLNPVVVYNGQILNPPYTKDDFNINTGSMQFIKNSKGNNYNVVFINDYDVYVVNTVNSDSEIVYPKYRPDALQISKSAVPEYRIINARNNKEMKIGDIVEWNVLNVMHRHPKQSEGRLTIKLSKKNVSGILEGIGDDYVTINGKDYNISKNFFPYATGMKKHDNAALGKEITVYLDINENIVAADYSENKPESYVYATKIYQNSNIKGDVVIKAFTTNGVWEELSLCDDVNFNGTIMKASEIADRDNGLINISKFDEMVQTSSSEYVVSLADADKVNVVGSWSQSSATEVSGPNGEISYYTREKTDSISYSAKGIPAGTYGVYYWRVVLYASTDGVDITVNHQDGTDVIRQDETLQGSGRGWQYLGNYTFDGTTGDVKFQMSSDATPGTTGAYATLRSVAVKFGEPVFAPKNPTDYISQIGLPIENPIYIEKNSEGKIKTIKTLTPGFGKSKWYYYSGNSIFVDNGTLDKIGFSVDSNTVVFKIPKDIEDFDRYKIITKNNFINETSYTLQPFEINDFLKAGVIVSYDGSNLDGNGNSIVVAEKVIDGYNNKKQEAKILKGFQNGKEVTYVGYDEKTFSNVQGGDIILLNPNEYGEVDLEYDGYEILHDHSAGKFGQISNLHSYYCCVYGQVTDVYEGGSVIKVNIGTENRTYYLSGATVYFCYKNKKESADIELGAVKDVSIGDNLAIRIARGSAREVVLYR